MSIPYHILGFGGYGLSFSAVLISLHHLGLRKWDWVAFVVALIVGLLLGVRGYFRENGHPILQVDKSSLGLVLAGSALAGSLILHFGWHYWAKPETLIPISAVLSFLIPYLLFEPLGKLIGPKPKKVG